MNAPAAARATRLYSPARREKSTMPERFESVSVDKKANVFFDGRCVSHTVHLPDGSRKSVGVILPSKLHFDTKAPEVMELIEGRCRVEIAGSGKTVEYRGGQRFEVPADSGFTIETLETLHYVCHFG
jgi:uncharacterized protein YaiE (UPF0345 family)